MNNSIFGESGIQITLLLILIPVLAGLVIAIVKTYSTYKDLRNRRKLFDVNKKIEKLTPEELDFYEKRKTEEEYQLPTNELSGAVAPSDEKGIIHNINAIEELRFIPHKKSYAQQKYISPQLAKLILYFIGFSIFWLLLGTTVGEYLGIKFVAPDADHVSWLSFGRLRPVHTNMVFWGWASFAMVGLSYYVIPRVSNVQIHSLKVGWITLILMNVSVLAGTISLMAGINNGGGEYREYIWPIMAIFAAGIVLSLYNFLMTVAKRVTKEIYVSNWYIISAMMYVVVILVVAYILTWQD